MTSPEAGPVTRFVWRVEDMLVPAWPGLAVRACSRCRQPVYVDTGQAVPARLADAVLVCVPCGLADPEHRPALEKMHARVQAAVRRFSDS